MKEEFKRLMELFDRHQKGEKINLDELLSASTAFFANLKDEFVKADEEEKKEIMVMVNQMYAVLLAQSKKIAAMTGIKEEELNSYVQNPNNFSPEQWRMMQETRDRIFSSSKEITSYLKGKAPGRGEPSDPSQQVPGGGTPAAPRKKRGPRSARGKWMKS